MAPAARAVLERSRIKRIHVIGRRGPAQASFGENEIQEFGALPGVAFCIDPAVAFTSPADEAELADPAADRARAVVRTLRELAGRAPVPDARVTIGFDFLRRPIGSSGTARVEGITMELCRLEGEPGRQHAVPTGARASGAGGGSAAEGRICRRLDQARGEGPDRPQPPRCDGDGKGHLGRRRVIPKFART